MVNSTPPNSSSLPPSGLDPLPPRKKRGPGRQIVVMVIMVALLSLLIFWIKSIGDGGGAVPGTPPPKAAALPKFDVPMLEAKWPQIVAGAAAPARGNPQARYTIAEFGDFECPQCGKVYPVLETLLQKYPAQVNLIFLHRPFAKIHPWAVPAGQASEIAAAQGKFWPMYDLLYTHQDNLESGFYSTYAETVGLDKAKFKAAFDAGAGLPQMKAATALADSLGVQETPTMLLRDNQTQKITVYVGKTGDKNPDGTPRYPGIDEVLAQPPWAR